MTFNPTMYKISTITATGGVNTCIDLDVLYDNIHISEDNHFQYIEFGKRKSNVIFKGTNKKLAISRRKKKETKRFDNQATTIINHHYNGADLSVNMKIFKNGNVQITGLKHVDQGSHIVDILIDELKRIYKTVDTNVVQDYDKLANVHYSIRLINSDFRIGIEIKRDKLFKILKTKYGIQCSYEQCIYPGVKIQYFHNKQCSESGSGKCLCTPSCQGKGSGLMINDCKKITIAVFQSGCIIITGAHTYDQIDEAYNFICNIIKNEIDEIRKVTFQPPIKTT